MVLRDALSPYFEALLRGIESDNWLLSLMAAFTLPDICTFGQYHYSKMRRRINANT